jgi:hypothetical protein
MVQSVDETNALSSSLADIEELQQCVTNLNLQVSIPSKSSKK